MHACSTVSPSNNSFTYPFIYFTIFPLSTHHFVRLPSIHLSICPSIFIPLSIHLSISPFFRPSSPLPSIRPYFCPSILSVHHSVCPFVCWSKLNRPSILPLMCQVRITALHQCLHQIIIGTLRC